MVSDGQTRVLEALEQKTKKAIKLYESLVKNVNTNYKETKKQFSNTIIKPNF